VPDSEEVWEVYMSAEMKKGYTSTLILIALGVLVLYVGAQWLLLLIPAAILAWYSAGGPTLKRSRN
jgi:hypothetical protein